MLAICIPTYNERESLPLLIDALETRLGSLPAPVRVLIVDDSSPDGTGHIAAQLAATRAWLGVIHRPRKEGIGPAYLDAFAAAADLGAGRIVTMDCDLSHDPADLPRLLAATRHADLVIGSRYVEGGSVLRWGTTRRLISRGGCAYARVALGSGIRDLTSGYRVLRRAVLDVVALEDVTSRGYAFQIEVAARAERAGLRVLEIPIVFDERRVGGSKLSPAIVAEAAWRVPALRAAMLAQARPRRRPGPGLYSPHV